MKIRKRYLGLILIALLPLTFLIHFGDYCFGVKELLIIIGLAIFFVITFLVILFHNLYSIALKKELFNYRPFLIGVVYLVVLSLLLNYHDAYLFKTKKSVFETNNSLEEVKKITFFTDKQFELKMKQKHYRCVYKGSFNVSGEIVYLNFNQKNHPLIDTVFYYSKNRKQLFSKNRSVLFTKTNNPSKKENYKYFSE